MADAEQKTSKAGPYGGGNKYGQMTMKSTFIPVTPDRPSGKYGKKPDDSTAPRGSSFSSPPPTSK